jgi:hypothetical protein
LLRTTTAPQQQRHSVAAMRAKVAPQHCRSACCNSAAATRAAAVLPRRVLQQRHNAPATRAATTPQHCCDASCNIITLWACSAAASRACTVATPRCHRHRHKAHGRVAAWWPLMLRCRFSSVGLTSCILHIASYGPAPCHPTSYIIHNNTWYFSNCTLC